MVKEPTVLFEALPPGTPDDSGNMYNESKQLKAMGVVLLLQIIYSGVIISA